ncbi:MAG: hypothetical protein AB7E28_07470 [Desulfurella sp.]
MIDLPFIDCVERTEFSDECYGAFGRALYVAQHFEANCRGLVAILKLKAETEEVDLLNDKEFIKSVNKIWKHTFGKNLKVLETYRLAKEMLLLLDKARKSRNKIAHEMTLGIEHEIEEYEGRKKILQSIASAVRDIATGDGITGFFLQYITKEPLPSVSYLSDYPENVVKWVCETFY